MQRQSNETSKVVGQVRRPDKKFLACAEGKTKPSRPPLADEGAVHHGGAALGHATHHPEPRAHQGASSTLARAGSTGYLFTTRRKVCTTLFAIAVVRFAAGCTYSGGEFLFLMGVGRGAIIEAKFQLTEGPLMIFVDDIHERMDGPLAGRTLFDELAQELLKHGAAKKIIPLKTVEQLRQSVLHFEKRGCREIGELAHAKQVLWIEVQDFLAREQIFDANNAAYFLVTVRVINVQEKKSRMRVRLWPKSPNGHSLSMILTGSEVAMAGSKDAIGKELAKRLAVEIARLFYDHRAGDFERES